jgi:hypothetical protein
MPRAGFRTCRRLRIGAPRWRDAHSATISKRSADTEFRAVRPCQWRGLTGRQSGAAAVRSGSPAENSTVNW